jgi:hypothetical protein
MAQSDPGGEHQALATAIRRGFEILQVAFSEWRLCRCANGDKMLPEWLYQANASRHPQSVSGARTALGQFLPPSLATAMEELASTPDAKAHNLYASF